MGGQRALPPSPNSVGAASGFEWADGFRTLSTQNVKDVHSVWGAFKTEAIFL